MAEAEVDVTPSIRVYLDDMAQKRRVRAAAGLADMSMTEWVQHLIVHELETDDGVFDETDA